MSPRRWSSDTGRRLPGSRCRTYWVRPCQPTVCRLSRQCIVGSPDPAVRVGNPETAVAGHALWIDLRRNGATAEVVSTGVVDRAIAIGIVGALRVGRPERRTFPAASAWPRPEQIPSLPRADECEIGDVIAGCRMFQPVLYGCASPLSFERTGQIRGIPRALRSRYLQRAARGSTAGRAAQLPRSTSQRRSAFSFVASYCR